LSAVTQIGKYQILEQVGEGAMGVVYKAKDPVLNRTVAVKVMSEGLAQDASLRERFLREAQAAGSLQHPNLVTIYDFGETDGHLFIAMEFIEGADLETLLEQKAPMPLTAKLDLMIDVLNGLSFAHRRGIIHRDIKPANIRIDQEGRARIMDFGVARMATSNLTGTGTMMGTPNYMAPEQITGEALTPAVDLWSVGAVLYELLTNKKPFQAETLHRVLFRIVSEPPTDLLGLAPGLPAGLDLVVQKALEKNPDDRFRTASEMANAVAAVRAKMGGPRLSRTVSQRSSIEEAIRVRQQAQAQPANRRWVVVTGGLAAGLAIAVAVVLFAVRDRNPTDTSTIATVSPPPSAAPARDTATVQAAPPAPLPGAPSSPPAAGEGSRLASSAPTAPGESKAPPRRAAPDSVPARRTDTPRVVTSAPTQVAPATQGTPSTQTTSVVTSPPVNAPQPVVPVPPPLSAAPAVENPRTAITAMVDDYATAIATRQVAELRRVYPGMTAQQQSGWESLFSSVRSIKATLEVTSLNVTDQRAVARVSGAYAFVNRAGRSEQRPAAFEATFQWDGDRWRLQAIR
jgi:serine/threonine protein kinase